MSQPSTLPQKLMSGALLHFENGVPIDDLDLHREHRDRLARVQHVYWIWLKSPLLDVMGMFRQMAKGKYANRSCDWAIAKRDKMLFDFVRDHVSPPSRREDEMKVRYAAEQAIRIGSETDNAQALVKGGKLLYDVAHLGQPENEQADLSKAAFLPSVVTTCVKDVDDTKDDVDDAETKRILGKYDAYVDEKRKMIDDKVEVMMAKRNGNNEESEPCQD